MWFWQSLAIKEWIEEMNYEAVASRKNIFSNYPVLISSWIELLSHHWGSLEGKQVAILCNADNESETNRNENKLTNTDSKMIGIALFLALAKHNATWRLICKFLL